MMIKSLNREVQPWPTAGSRPLVRDKQEATKAAQYLASAQKLLAETQASQNQFARELTKLVAQVAALKKE